MYEFLHHTPFLTSHSVPTGSQCSQNECLCCADLPRRCWLHYAWQYRTLWTCKCAGCFRCSIMVEGKLSELDMFRFVHIFILVKIMKTLDTSNWNTYNTKTPAALFCIPYCEKIVNIMTYEIMGLLLVFKIQHGHLPFSMQIGEMTGINENNMIKVDKCSWLTTLMRHIIWVLETQRDRSNM